MPLKTRPVKLTASADVVKTMTLVEPAFSCFCRYCCSNAASEERTSGRRADEKSRMREREVRLFLGGWSYLCQVSGEESPALRPRVFSGPANPAVAAGEGGPPAGGWRKVSPNRWPPFLRLSGGKGGNYAEGMKRGYGAFFYRIHSSGILFCPGEEWEIKRIWKNAKEGKATQCKS